MINKNKQANKQSGTWSIRLGTRYNFYHTIIFTLWRAIQSCKETDMTWKDIKLFFAYDMIICQGNLTTGIQI